jgi:hypothetical protein
MTRRLVALAAGALATAVPALAEACPACAARDNGGPTMAVMLTAFVLFPFAITSVVIYAIRRDQREDPAERGQHP